jgi:hypothetical protein
MCLFLLDMEIYFAWNVFLFLILEATRLFLIAMVN